MLKRAYFFKPSLSTTWPLTKLPTISPIPIKIIAVEAFCNLISFDKSSGIVLTKRGKSKPARMATLSPFQIKIGNSGLNLFEMSMSQVYLVRLLSFRLTDTPSLGKASSAFGYGLGLGNKSIYKVELMHKQVKIMKKLLALIFPRTEAPSPFPTH